MTDRTQKHRSPPQDAPEQVDASKPSGRVTFDERGNSVWEWKTDESGKYSFDVNTHYMKKLEAPELELEEKKDERGKIERPEARDASATKSGFNPYDRGGIASQSSTPTRSDQEATPATRKPIKDLRRYNEWMKLKQRMAEKKDDE